MAAVGTREAEGDGALRCSPTISMATHSYVLAAEFF
jgi:hypothetical protein